MPIDHSSLQNIAKRPLSKMDEASRASSSLPFLGWIMLGALLVASIAAFVFLAALQLRGMAMQGVQIDEYYFSACAARGLDLGAVPVSCHDNKPPLIFLLYEAIFAVFGLYNFVALKFVTYALVLANAALLGVIAFRLASGAAAMLAMSLWLICLTADIGNVALKTELVGGVFVTMALLLLSTPQALTSYYRLALAGFLIGVAVVTKQPYAFIGFAIIAWLLLSTSLHSRRALRQCLARSAIFSAALLLPFLLLWLAFASEGRADDYLLSFFLYPMVYGSSSGHSFADLIRKIATVTAAFSDHVLLAGLAAGAMVLVVTERPVPRLGHRFSEPRWLLVLVIAFLLLAFLLTPVWLPYHIVLIAGPMALLSGIVFGDFWRRTARARPQAGIAIFTIITIGNLTSVAETWRSDGIRYEADPKAQQVVSVHADATARYAYELGQQPQLYARGGFIPASTVQFPWALPGTPEMWAYSKPPAGSALLARLEIAQAQNLAQLYADFRRTPPRYILLQSNYVAAPDRPNQIDIPDFQAYLDDHCQPSSVTDIGSGIATTLYECDGTKPIPTR